MGPIQPNIKLLISQYQESAHWETVEGMANAMMVERSANVSELKNKSSLAGKILASDM